MNLESINTSILLKDYFDFQFAYKGKIKISELANYYNI